MISSGCSRRTRIHGADAMKNFNRIWVVRGVISMLGIVLCGPSFGATDSTLNLHGEILEHPVIDGHGAYHEDVLNTQVALGCNKQCKRKKKKKKLARKTKKYKDTADDIQAVTLEIDNTNEEINAVKAERIKLLNNGIDNSGRLTADAKRQLKKLDAKEDKLRKRADGLVKKVNQKIAYANTLEKELRKDYDDYVLRDGDPTERKKELNDMPELKEIIAWQDGSDQRSYKAWLARNANQRRGSVPDSSVLRAVQNSENAGHIKRLNRDIKRAFKRYDDAADGLTLAMEDRQRLLKKRAEAEASTTNKELEIRWLNQQIDNIEKSMKPLVDELQRAQKVLNDFGVSDLNPLLRTAEFFDSDVFISLQGPYPTCGYHACRTFLNTQGKPVSAYSILKNYYKAGTNARDWARILNDQGVKVDYREMADEKLSRAARYAALVSVLDGNTGGPVIVGINYVGADLPVDVPEGEKTALLHDPIGFEGRRFLVELNKQYDRYGHAVMVDRIENGYVVIRDPNGYLYKSPESEFMKYFDGGMAYPRPET